MEANNYHENLQIFWLELFLQNDSQVAMVSGGR